MPKKDKYACFQWIRDVREKRNREMEGMTPEERSDYGNAKGDEALRKLPVLTPKERERLLHEFLYSAGKPAVRRKAVKHPAHA